MVFTDLPPYFSKKSNTARVLGSLSSSPLSSLPSSLFPFPQCSLLVKLHWFHSALYSLRDLG